MTATPEPPAAAEQESAPQQPVRRRGRGSAGDMIRSMVVILGIVLVVWLLVPRPSSVARPTVDVAAAAEGAAPKLGFAPAVPQGLAEGWVARTAQSQRGTDGILTWHLGYITPDERFAGVQQAADPTRAWENRQVTDGREQGTVEVAGRTWIVRSRTDRGITSWVLRGPEVTTVVTGNAERDELEELAESLRLGG